MVMLNYPRFCLNIPKILSKLVGGEAWRGRGGEPHVPLTPPIIASYAYECTPIIQYNEHVAQYLLDLGLQLAYSGDSGVLGCVVAVVVGSSTVNMLTSLVSLDIGELHLQIQAVLKTNGLLSRIQRTVLK